MPPHSEEELAVIRASADKITASSVLSQSSRMSRLFSYLLGAYLNGSDDRLNQMAIAVDVFDRDEAFDPAVDSVVRVEAGRLRNKLREYYESEGLKDPVRFDMPKGKYRLKLTFNDAPGPGLIADSAEQGDPLDKGKGEQLLSIAVLPFESLSNDSADSGLADELTIELIDQIGRTTVFETVSRRTSLAYKGKFEDVRTIAASLEVEYVVEGSFRRSGNRLRISVALINGISGKQVWFESYDIEDSDPIDLETRLAKEIVAALLACSWRITADAMSGKPAESAVNQQSLKLIFNFSERNCQLGKKQALANISRNEDSAESYGVLAFHSMQEYINHWTDDLEQTRLEGLAAANQAIALGSNNYWAQWGAAVAFEWLGEPRRALMIMESAKLLHPDDPIMGGFYGHTLLHVGRFEEGLEALSTVLATGSSDMFMPPFHIFTCLADTLLGRYDAAVTAGENCWHGMMNSSATNALFYANALSLNNQQEAAQDVLREACRLSPRMTLSHYKMVCTRAFAPAELSRPLFEGVEQLNWTE